jgi:predicted aspartyl protease
MTRAVALVPALALAACVQMDGAPTAAAVTGAGEIPFTLAGAGGAAIVVPVQINGQGPFRLVLDTGATFTCLDNPVVERLELPKAAGMVGYGATIGESGAVSLHRIDSLAVGEATATSLIACALDLRGVNKMGFEVDGLLGLNFLKAFKVVLDFERNVLSLSQP